MSNEEKFTKGEWYWVWDDCDCEHPCSHGKYATSLRSKISETKETKTTTPVIYTVEDINNYDAHLIASAPEMYEMLKSLSEMMPMLDEQTHPQIEMDAVKHDIDSLLTKARGES